MPVAGLASADKFILSVVDVTRGAPVVTFVVVSWGRFTLWQRPLNKKLCRPVLSADGAKWREATADNAPAEDGSRKRPGPKALCVVAS